MLPGHTYANCSCRLEKKELIRHPCAKREKRLSCEKKDFLDFTKITKSSSSSSNDEAMEAALIFPGMAHHHITDRWRLLSSESSSFKVNAKSCATQSLSFSLTHSQLEAKALSMFKNRKKGITWGWWWRWWSTSSSSSAAKEWLHTKEKLEANFVVILIVGAAQLNGHEEGVAAANDQRGIVLVENVVLEGAVLLRVVALKQVHRGDVIWGA